MNFRWFSLARFGAALLAAGVGGAARAADSSRPPAANAPAEEDCATFGRQLAALLNRGEGEAALQLLDQFALLDRIANGLGFSAPEEADFRAGLFKTLPAALKQQFATFSQTKFVRIQNVGGHRRALLRLTTDDGAVNYIGFVCTRRGTGPVRWADMFIYLSGELLSETTRRTALPLIAQSRKGILDRLTGTESAMVRYFPAIQRATQLMQGGKRIEAWAECEKLPEALKVDRTVLLLRMRIAQGIDDIKYLRVIDQWRTAFPDDPTLEFISVDGAFLRKDYAAALGHVDAFARQLGGDAYLDFLAANALLMAERYPEARARARAALAVEPGLTSAFDSLLTISLKSRNYSETVAVLEELRTAFPGIDLSAITSDESYAEFRLSTAYLAWSARQKEPSLPASSKK